MALLDLGIPLDEISRSHSRHTTLGNTPLDEASTLCRKLHFLTTQNNLDREISELEEGFETLILTNKRPHFRALKTARPLGSAMSCINGEYFPTYKFKSWNICETGKAFLSSVNIPRNQGVCYRLRYTAKYTERPLCQLHCFKRNLS